MVVLPSRRLVVLVRTTVLRKGGAARRCDYVRNGSALRNRGQGLRRVEYDVRCVLTPELRVLRRTQSRASARTRAARAVRLLAPVFMSSRSTCFSTVRGER